MHIKLLLLVLAGTIAAMSTPFARPACLCFHELDSADNCGGSVALLRTSIAISKSL
jgi:hypothetical protein